MDDVVGEEDVRLTGSEVDELWSETATVVLRPKDEQVLPIRAERHPRSVRPQVERPLPPLRSDGQDLELAQLAGRQQVAVGADRDGPLSYQVRGTKRYRACHP